MNKLIATGNVFAIIVLFTLSCTSFAATGTFGSGNLGDGSGPDPKDTSNTPKIVGSLEQAVTVVKNETQEVLGNLFCSLPIEQTCPDSDPLSLELISSPAGNYGILEIFGNEKFRYVIKNDLPQVQALGFQDVATDTFFYTIKEGGNAKTNGKLTVYILGNPSVSFDNVEIEFNDISSQATSIHAGDASKQGQYMRGQLVTASDRDWFVFNSLGNEIINLELCPEGSQCRDENSWVMYVFDADRLSQQSGEFDSFTLRRYVKESGEVLNTSQADHMYLLLNKGSFNDSLIGLIDPCFGDRRTLDIGVGATPKNYLVAITSPLFRQVEDDSICGSGDVIQEEEIPVGPGVTIIEEFLTARYSDDQYTLKVTRTGEDPFTVIQPSNTTFDAVGRKVNIPQLRVNDKLFALQLQQAITATDTPVKFNIQSIESMDEAVSSDPYLPTYNPVNQVVKIPQVVLPGSGDIYSVELLYQPSDGTLLLLKADPVN